MKAKISQRATYWLGVAAVGLVVGLGIQFATAWTEPTVAPPGGNVGAPINTGNILQSKTGSLVIGGAGLFETYNSAYLATLGGRVGIGMGNPNNTIQVADLINFDNIKYGTFLGYQAGNVNTETNNTFVGYQSGSSNTTGFSNTAMGSYTLLANTTGNYNSAMGQGALESNTTGNSNLAMGKDALKSNTTGQWNSAMGHQSLYFNTTGSANIAIGLDALRSNATDNYNTAIGNRALSLKTTGSANSAMGYNAGRYQADGTTDLETANNSVYIGAYSKGFNNSDNNSIVIGADAIGIGANSVVLGNNSITKTILKGNVGIGTTDPKSKLHVIGLLEYAGNAEAITGGLTVGAFYRTGEFVKVVY